MQFNVDWNASQSPNGPLPSPSFGQLRASPAQAEEQAPRVTVVQCTSVNVVHRLFSSALSEEKNVQCYGRAAMSLHGHKLDFEIKFSGPVVRATGQILGAGPLDDVMTLAVHEVLENQNLDTDVPFFLSRPSTLENIALLVYRNLSVILAPSPVSASEVTVETVPCPRAGQRVIQKTRVTFAGEMMAVPPSSS